MVFLSLAFRLVGPGFRRGGKPLFKTKTLKKIAGNKAISLPNGSDTFDSGKRH